MGVFRPTPMQLEYGEPVHVMMARAFLTDAIKVSGGILGDVSWHFTGPHGIQYRGSKTPWSHSDAETAAMICEEIQQDFNERIAAMDKARQYARDTLSVPSLFAPVKGEDE